MRAVEFDHIEGESSCHALRAFPSLRQSVLSNPHHYSLAQSLNSIRLDAIRNGPAPTFTYCHLTSAKGKYQREAIGHSISVCYDIFAKNRVAASSRERDALNTAMNWMGPDSTDRLGICVLINMAAVGAMHAGVTELLKAAPNDAELLNCQRELEAAITRLGVRIGRCRTAPDGAYNGHEKTWKLHKAQRAAISSLTKGLVRIGGQRLIDGIAQSIVARPMLHSIIERRPRLAAMLDSPHVGPIDLHRIVDENSTREDEEVIGAMLENGTPESMIRAIFTLVMSPDSVKLGMPLDAALSGLSAEPR